MNREFEFRIYDKLEKVMLTYDNWREIVDEKDEKYYSDEWYPCYDLLTNLFYLDVHIENDRYIVMQYTGLKDKNGVKIFEGDILREYSNDIEDWVVSYEHGKFVGNCDNVCEDLYELSDLEVIGNIYENNLESEGK